MELFPRKNRLTKYVHLEKVRTLAKLLAKLTKDTKWEKDMLARIDALDAVEPPQGSEQE